MSQPGKVVNLNVWCLLPTRISRGFTGRINERKVRLAIESVVIESASKDSGRENAKSKKYLDFSNIWMSFGYVRRSGYPVNLCKSMANQ